MMAMVQYKLFLQTPEIDLRQSMATEGQTYEMVKDNDVVIHRPTSSWNTPGEGLAWIIFQINREAETEHSNQIPVHREKQNVAYPRHPTTLEWGQRRATIGGSIRGTSDISGPSRKISSDN